MSAVYSRRSLIWIIGISAASFALALVLTAFADDLGEPNTVGPNTFSRSAIGHHAARAFLEESGILVRIRRSERLDNIDPTVPVLAVEPRTALTHDEDQLPGFDRLRDAVHARGAPLVVVLPKWNGVPSQTNPRWLADVVPVDSALIHALLARLMGGAEIPEVASPVLSDGAFECDSEWGSSYSLKLRRPMLLQPAEEIEPLVDCAGGWLAGRLVDEQGLETIIVTDPGILNTHGLGMGDNAALLHDLVYDGLGVDTLMIDETIHGFTRNSGLLAELFRFPLSLAVIHGTLLLGLVVWSGSSRFGAPRPPRAAVGSGKQVLINNTAQLLGVIGQAGEALPRYFAQAIRDVSAHYFLPPNMPEDRRLKRLAELGKSRKLDIDLKQIKRLVESPDRTDPVKNDKALEAAMRLYTWREEMMRVD